MVEYLDVKVIVSSKSSVDLRLQWISLYYELPHKKKKPPDPRHIWDGRKRSLSERNKLLVQQQQQPGRGDYTLCDVKKGSPECFRRHFLKSHVKRGM